MEFQIVFLLDTHVVVWIALAPDNISKAAGRAIDDARRKGTGLAIADITLFELAVLVSRNRIRLQVSLESFLSEIEARFVVLPITRQIAERAVQFPESYPRDPMDRLIGATAVVGGLALITADEQVRRSRLLNTIW